MSAAVLDAMDRKLAGLRVWRASSVGDLQQRDIASTQSEAMYSLLNDYLERVDGGETVATWVTLDPAGTTRRFLQSHHIFAWPRLVPLRAAASDHTLARAGPPHARDPVVF